MPCCCDFVQLLGAFITDLLPSQLRGFIKETVLCSFQKNQDNETKLSQRKKKKSPEID